MYEKRNIAAHPLNIAGFSVIHLLETVENENYLVF